MEEKLYKLKEILVIRIKQIQEIVQKDNKTQIHYKISCTNTMSKAQSAPTL